MKITSNEISALQQGSAGKLQKISGEGFQDILNEKMGQAQAKAGQPAALPPMSNIDGIRFDPAGEPDTKQTLTRMDCFLTLLETYSAQMEDPRISLKQTATLVSQMEEQIPELLPLLDTLPEESGVRDLLNRLLVTSTVETIKFNRGDYLPR